jgi:hypothetical protein
MATVAPPLVALVDFHDAKVSEVRLLPGGCVILSFSTINVFERTAEEDRFDVWVYRMTLLTEDVKSLQSSGTWSVDTFVAELTVDGEAPKGDPWVFGADGGAHQFALAFIGGASILWTGTRAVLKTSARVKYLERWEGPLVSSV